MSYPTPFNTRKLKEVLTAKKAGKPYDYETFLYLHLYRNYFNVGSEVTTLTFVSNKKYIDNLGNTWNEISMFKNWFHMPKGNYFSSALGMSVPYSRKFLRKDGSTGIGGEFEMIIRHDNKRIDALTQEDYQETYNYGRTDNTTEHKLLDVDPHGDNPGYLVRKDCGWTKIIEKK